MGAAGLPPRRIDQQAAPTQPGLLPAPASGLVVARRVIITGAGDELLVYNGAQALGNLAESIRPNLSPTTDQFGNLIPGGQTFYANNPNRIGGPNYSLASFNFGNIGSFANGSGFFINLSGLRPSPGSLTGFGAAILGLTYNPIVPGFSNGTGNPQLLLTGPFPGSFNSQVGSALYEIQPAVATTGGNPTVAFGIGLAGDTVYRFQIDVNGKIQFGPGGAGALDLNLYRQAAGVLATDQAFNVGAALGVLGAASFFSGLGARQLADAFNEWQVTNQGVMSWGTGAVATDTTLQRVIDSNSNPVLHSPNGAEFLTLNIPQNSATAAHFGVDSGGLIYLIGGTVATALRALAKLAADTNNRWSMDANGLMLWGTGAAAGDTTLQRVAAATLQLTSILNLVDAITPGTPSGATAVYSKTGNLHYVGEDANDYNTGIKHLAVYPVQTINAITFSNVTGAALHVGAYQYRIKVKVWYTSSAGAGTPQFQLTSPATSGTISFMAIDSQTGVSPAVRAGTGSLTPGAGPTLPAAGVNAVADMEFDATFTASGSVQLQALTSAVADTYVVQAVYMDLFTES